MTPANSHKRDRSAGYQDNSPAKPLSLARFTIWGGTIAMLVGIGAALGYTGYEQRHAENHRRQAILTSLPPGYQFPGCDEVRRLGAAPIYRGEPGYSARMDGDDDGIACEQH